MAAIIDQTRPDQTRPDLLLRFNFDLITIPKVYEYSGESYSLEVWGDFWNEVPEDLIINQFTLDELQKLNFDGGYLAYYRNFQTNKHLVFRGHVDSFPFFYCSEGNNIIFSDNFYSLASRFKTLTLNLDSVADYFELGWNNIIKWDRTPFKEIKRIECWTYMTEGKDSQPLIRSWKNLDASTKFNEHNLEDFKREFFECTDFYLKKIHDRYSDVIFSVSSGMDSNTLAARYVQLFPDNNARFYTSKIDDVTDESKIALSMEAVLHKKITLVQLKTNTLNYLELLKKHIDKDLPPRFNGLINEGVLCNELVNIGLNMPNINGMGADGKFGEFGGEYLYLMRELLAKFRLFKAYRTFKGFMVSFQEGENSNDISIIANFIKLLAKKFIGKIKRAVFENRKTAHSADGLLKISMPPCASSLVKTHKDAIQYASQSGEVRDINIEFAKCGIKAAFPYTGYKFCELSANCDPFIFSDRVNKSCERYAAAELLPPEIIRNVKKSGNPAMTLQKSLNSNNNLEHILNYIKGRESKIVNSEKLYQNFRDNHYGQKEFLALCLLIFEEKINSGLGIEIVLS